MTDIIAEAQRVTAMRECARRPARDAVGSTPLTAIGAARRLKT